MYTEIELSEFIIRCRLKIGELALNISEGQRYGKDVTDLINQSTFLRIFANTVHADSNDWSLEDKYKRIEFVASAFKLTKRPTYSQDLINKFKPLSQIVVEGNTLLELPKTGEGYVYLNNGVITLIPEVKNTINDLPLA